jgi:hypothetical protein
MMRGNKSLRGSQPPSPSGSEDDNDSLKSPRLAVDAALAGEGEGEGEDQSPSRGARDLKMGAQKKKAGTDGVDGMDADAMDVET